MPLSCVYITHLHIRFSALMPNAPIGRQRRLAPPNTAAAQEAAEKVQQLLMLHLLSGLEGPHASAQDSLALATRLAPLLFNEGPQGRFLRAQRKPYLKALWLLQVLSACSTRQACMLPVRLGST